MRKLIAMLLLLASCYIQAGDNLKFNGEFNNPTKGIPAKWILNSALPGEVKTSKAGKLNIITITAGAKVVHVYTATIVPVIAGNKLSCSIKVKGTGKADIGVYCYTKINRYLGANNIKVFAVDAEWKTLSFELDMKDFKDKKLGKIRIILGANKNSSVSFANFKVDRKLGTKKTFRNNTIPKTSIPFSLVLPKTTYGVPGIKSAIYLDNIIITKTPDKYSFTITPDMGKITGNVWTIIPTAAQVGKHLLHITVTEKSNKKNVAQGDISLNIAPATAGDGGDLNLLIIGDSLTGASQYPREVARLLAQDKNPKLTMLGTLKKGNGVAHEGYGGWTWKSFISKYTTKSVHKVSKGSSPFVFLNATGKPELDMVRYFTEKCNGIKPDVITLFLGINDCFYLSRRLDNMKAVNQGIDKVFRNAEVLIKVLHAAAPKAKIGICLTPVPNSRQKAFEANYKDSYNRWGWKQLQHILVQRQIKHFGNRQQENISIIPTELNIDSVNGYPENNAVHPNKQGYNQLAATIYCWIKWQIK
jgi:lysophospholipase L1-like esterase